MDRPINPKAGSGSPATAAGWSHVLWGGVDSSSNTTFTESQSASNASGDGGSEPDTRNADPHQKVLAKLDRRKIDHRDISFRDTQSSGSSAVDSAPPVSKGASRNAPNAPISWGDVRGVRTQPNAKGKPSAGAVMRPAISGPSSQPQSASAPVLSASPPSAGAAVPKAGPQPILLEEALRDMSLDDLADLSDGDSQEEVTAEQSAQQQREHQAMMNTLMGVPGSMEEMLKKVPLDSNGAPTSIGSIGHFDGECKVCLFVYAKPGCMNGVKCSFCHFPHKRLKRKNKMRPCKGKRDRYRKLVIRLTQLIEEDPDSFNLDGIELPPSIERSDTVKEKLRRKMQLYADRVRAQRSSGGFQQDRAPADVPLRHTPSGRPNEAERIPPGHAAEIRGHGNPGNPGWNSVLASQSNTLASSAQRHGMQDQPPQLASKGYGKGVEAGAPVRPSVPQN